MSASSAAARACKGVRGVYKGVCGRVRMCAGVRGCKGV